MSQVMEVLNLSRNGDHDDVNGEQPSGAQKGDRVTFLVIEEGDEKPVEVIITLGKEYSPTIIQALLGMRQGEEKRVRASGGDSFMVKVLEVNSE